MRTQMGLTLQKSAIIRDLLSESIHMWKYVPYREIKNDFTPTRNSFLLK